MGWQRPKNGAKQHSVQSSFNRYYLKIRKLTLTRRNKFKTQATNMGIFRSTERKKKKKKE